MTQNPRSTRTVLLTLLATAALALLTVAIAFFAYHRFVPPPADILNASSVILYGHQVRATDWQSWQRFFPQLASVPVPTLPAEIALIGSSAADAAWVLFPAPDDPLTTQANYTADGVAFLTNAPNTESLFAKESEERLSALPAFRALEGTHIPASVFTNLALLQPSTDPYTERVMGLIPGESSAFLLRTQNGRVQARWYAADRARMLYGGANALPSLSPTPAFSVTGNDVATFVQLLPQADDARMRLGTIATIVRNVAGKDVSAEFDVLPLLSGAASVHLLPTGSGGTTDILLEGHAPNEQLLMRTIDRLHRGVASSPQETTIITRTDPADGSLVGRSVLSEAAAPTSTQEERNGWLLRTTVAGNTGLFTATRGTTFAISTRADWLQERLTGSTPSVFVTGSPVRAGFLDLSLARKRTVIPLSLPGMMMDLLPASGSVQWSMETNGPVLTITMNARE